MNPEDTEALIDAVGNGGAALLLAGIAWALFGLWAGVATVVLGGALATAGLVAVAVSEGAK